VETAITATQSDFLESVGERILKIG